jgi:hypothetical protein
MTKGRPVRNQGRFRAIFASMFVASLLLASVGAAQSQDDASDDIEISIAVHPSSATLVAPLTPVVPITLGVTPTPAPGIPGTISAQLMLVRHGAGTNDGDAIVFLVIRDDRGMALGWNIVFTSLPIGSAAWTPELLDNKQLTIRRVLPEDGRLSDQVQGISTGRTLGPFANPIPLLHAGQGSSSGLFLQELRIVFPVSGSATPLGILFVQIPFAP